VVRVGFLGAENLVRLAIDLLVGLFLLGFAGVVLRVLPGEGVLGLMNQIALRLLESLRLAFA
jgi:hypothetical protein